MKKGMTRIGLLSLALIGLTVGANAQWTETATAVYLTNGTKPVGIGTNAPSYPLDIKQAGNSNFRIQSTTSGSANLILSRSAVAGVNCLVNYKTGVTNLWLTGVFGNTQDFRIRNGVGTDNLFISQTTGYLGINNTSPATQLDIKGLSNWDLSTTPGDVRIGDATNNIRMGVALAGGGAGFATIAATSSLQLGTGSTYPNLNTLNINGGRVGIGTTAPANKLAVLGNSSETIPVINATVSYVGSSDVRAIQGSSHPADGWGYGVAGDGGWIGVYGQGSGNTSSSFGVYGTASGTAGTQYGVYGYAYGGADNWGGYFPVKTYTSELRVGGTQGATGYVAAINGKLIATEVRVALQTSWPDYVFANDYNLMNIHQLEQNLKANNHLPGLPSACEVEDNGIQLGEMQTKIVEKLEESHLYIIQLQKQIDELKMEIKAMKK